MALPNPFSLAGKTTVVAGASRGIGLAIARAGGNKSQAARLLGLTRNALRYRLTQMGLE